MRHFLTLLLLSGGLSAFAQSIQLTPVLSGIPWLIGAKSDGNHSLYILRQDGFIHRFQGTNTLSANFLDWSTHIKLSGEQGLLGLAFHPDYRNNGYLYIYYSKTGTGESVLSRLSRSALDSTIADPNSEQILLTFPHPNPNHVGGALEFGPDGYLYLSVGDGGGAGDPDGNGQNNTRFLGKLLRIDVNNGNPYAIPADNPFVGQSDKLPEIYAYGLRNPWRVTFDRLTGDLWIGDVGQDALEEIDLIEAGAGGGQNFGWSCKEGTNTFKPCGDTLNSIPPLYEYPHNSNTNCSGSVTGGYVYRGYQYADLFGKYLFADFCTGDLTALDKSGGFVIGVPLGTFTPFDYVSFVEDDAGELYLAGYFSNKLYQISSVNCQPVAVIEVTTPAVPGCDSLLVPFQLKAYGGDVSGMNFQWRKDGIDLPGETGYQFSSNQPGFYDVVVTNPSNGCSQSSEFYGVQLYNGSYTFIEETVPVGTTFLGVEIQTDTMLSFNYQNIHGCDSVIVYDIKTVVSVNHPGDAFSNVTVTPNPGSGLFQVTGLPLNMDYRVVDVYGRVVTVLHVKDTPVVSLSLEGMPAGVYYLAGKKVIKL